jgi:hypothetical protein
MIPYHPSLCTVMQVMGLLLEPGTEGFGHSGTTLAFHGTRSARDLRTDLRVDMQKAAPPSLGKVHAGFRERHLQLLGEASSAVPAPDVIAGYSLGGAIAVLHALSCAEAGHAPGYVICIAPPRVGDERFAEYYNQRLGSRTIRIENTRDPVVSLPPGKAYAPVGRKVQVDFADGFFNHDLRAYHDRILDLYGPSYGVDVETLLSSLSQ